MLLSVPFGTPALYVNLSAMLPLPTTPTTGQAAAAAVATTTGAPPPGASLSSGSSSSEWVSATHDGPSTVQNAVLLKRHATLVLLLYHDLSNQDMRARAPANVTVRRHTASPPPLKAGRASS